MKHACAPLLDALREPARMGAFDDDTWDRVVRVAEAAGLLGRLGALARDLGLLAELPSAVARHLSAALNLAEQQRRSVLWEIAHLRAALRDFPGPVVLLKGAAYAAADLPPSRGRLFADIDLLVPKALIAEAESALMLAGWITSHHDAYDQRYYREWMHELPPMRHLFRGTVLDLHHDLLPETARLRTHADRLLAAAIPVPGVPGFAILAPADQVLHSATHLFHEGEWEHGLRDLVDLDALLRAYGHDDAFWPSLLARARELNLGRPLYYALRHARDLLATPMPPELSAICPDQPGTLSRPIMNSLLRAAFASAHPDCRPPGTFVAEFVLYVRSHWLRMPVHLLLPHLLRKAWVKRKEARMSKNETPRGNPDLDA